MVGGGSDGSDGGSVWVDDSFVVETVEVIDTGDDGFSSRIVFHSKFASLGCLMISVESDGSGFFLFFWLYLLRSIFLHAMIFLH